jgi:hypothetical protein
MKMPSQHTYAKIERERRFLLGQFPSNVNVVRVRCLTIFKLAQKVPFLTGGSQQGWVTSMYLTQDEFCVFTQLPASKLCETRYSVPPFGIDVFGGLLEGLLLAEAEFDSEAAANELIIPSFVVREVTTDSRFSGGRLVRASRQDIQMWLAEYGVPLGP